MGANGSALDVLGRLEIPITLGQFCASHEFVVVRHLTVQCLLGMEFLNRYGAVIDCVKNTLLLSPVLNPLPLVSNVTISETVAIPARSKMLIGGTLAYPSMLVGQEGLLEPTYKGQGKLLVAWSLNTVSHNNQLMMEVVNIGQAPITLYSGTTIANFSPNIAVHPISKKDEDMVSATMPNIDLNSSELNNSQRRELEALISEFREIYLCHLGNP